MLLFNTKPYISMRMPINMYGTNLYYWYDLLSYSFGKKRVKFNNLLVLIHVFYI